MTEPTEELIAKVREAAEDGRISCALLRKLAEDAGVPYREAGEAADRGEVRIIDCGLGCF